MENLLYFLPKSAGILFLFYGCYWLFLRKETFFISNRMFFLLGILLSLSLPWISFTETVILPLVTHNAMVATEAVALATDKSAIFPWTKLLLGLYSIGVLFFGLRLVFQFLTLYRLKKVSEITFEAEFRHVQTPKPIAPFSFFNDIFYHPKGFTSKELDTIIRHEKVHAVQKHSLDILMAEFLFIIQWFNPIVWLYKEHLKQNLEFLADEASQSTDRKYYQMLLLKEAIGTTNIPLATSFYNSIIKKRIVMLNQKRSKNISLVKSFIVLPVLAIFLMAFNTKTVYQVAEIPSTVSDIVIDKNTTNQELETLKKDFAEKELDFSYTAVRNEDFKIIDLALDMRDVSKNKATRRNGYFKTSSDGVIAPLVIRFYNKSNRIIIGNLDYGIPTNKSYTISTEKDEIKIEIDKDSKEETYTQKAGILAEKGIKIDFKGVKRNNKNEITDIKVFYDNGAGQKGSYVRKSNKPIEPFTITIKMNEAEPADISVTRMETVANGLIKIANTAQTPTPVTDVQHTGNPVLIIRRDTTKRIAIRLPPNTTTKSIKIKSDEDSKTILLNHREISLEELEVEGDAESILANTLKTEDKNSLGNHKTEIEELTIRYTNGNEELIKRIETEVENESEYVIMKQKGKFDLSVNDSQTDIIAEGGTVKFLQTKNDAMKPLIFIDGKKYPNKKIEDLDPNKIESISVLKGQVAIKSYGEEGKHGVILIITKKE